MTKKHCNNCNSQKESWADHPSYNSSETFARDERCWSCNRWTLSREMIENSPSFSVGMFFNPFAIVVSPFLGLNALGNIFNGKDLEDYIHKNKIREVEGSESEWQSKIEVPARNDCRIM